MALRLVFTFYVVLKKQVEMSKFTVDIWVGLSALFDQCAIIVSNALQTKHKQSILLKKIHRKMYQNTNLIQK